MTADKVRPYFLLAVLLGAFFLAFMVFKPFLMPLALATVFAVVLSPLFRRVARYTGKHRGIASLLTVLFSVIVILIPLIFFVFLIFREATGLYTFLVDGNGGAYLEGLVDSAVTFISPYVPQVEQWRAELATDVQAYAARGLSLVVSNLGAIVSSVTGLFLSLFIFFVALYYLLKDGHTLKDFVVRMSPLADTDDEAVFKRLESSINSVIKGNLSVAFTQGLVSGIGFTLFGLPNPVLWGFVTFFAAMVPAVGTSLVLVPAVLFLFFTGNVAGAMGLVVWGMVAVGLIDNLLGPRLIGRGIKLHPLLILLAVLGGITLFGPIGLFLGPLTISFLVALLSIYSETTKV